jgi:uncharacterized protein (TIGR02466 family)
MIIETILSNFIAYENICLNNLDIGNFCYRCEKEDPKGRVISNIGGWQSKDLSYKDINEPEMLKLFEIIKNRFVELTKNFNLINPEKMDIDNFWININKKNNTNVIHNHIHSIFTIVYYVKVPLNSGKIIFSRPSILYYEKCIENDIIEKYNEFNSSTYAYEPKEGDLIMFPAWLEHFVESNNTNEDRISIAFNSNYKDLL